MARTRNEETYNETRTNLLEVGMELIRQGSYNSVGINDVLRVSGAPKGSFYHYFSSKEEFGLEVVKHYHALQLDGAKQVLQGSAPAIDRLHLFFKTALKEFESRQFRHGCLMCNLSTELADDQPVFQRLLKQHWKALSTVIAGCIAELDKADIGLAHLTNKEAGDWLINNWSGALTRMKAAGSAEPLRLFMKSIFKVKA